MGDFVQENKRFLVIQFAGAMVFLIAWLIVGALFNDDIAKNKRGTKSARRKASVALPGGVDLNAVTRSMKDQDVSLGRLRGTVERTPDVWFTLEGKSDPDIHYNAVSDRIDEELVEQCARRNIEVDGDLGRPGKYPSTPRVFGWYLRGLEMEDQVLRLAIRAHDEVLEEGIVRIEPIEIAAPAKLRGRSRQVNPYFVEHAVDLTIVGHPKAVAFILEEIAREKTGDDQGKGLVVKEARIHSLDLPPGMQARGARRGPRRVASDPRNRGRVEARLRLASVDVNPGGVIRPKGKIR